jgi:Amt family ammonium transporter
VAFAPFFDYLGIPLTTARKRQIVGALFIIGWNIVWTSLILLFIKYALRIPLRMSEETLMVGDDAVHGVSLAFSFFQYHARD